MKRFFLALLTLLITVQPALADTWTVGQQPIVYPTNRFPILGDGSTSYGGTPPYYAMMPAAIATGEPFHLVDFTSTNSVTALPAGGGGFEAKFRTLCGTPTHYGYFDPAVSPNTAVFGHLHQFWGNTLTNGFSNYASLRKTGRSNCGGDVFNRTAYWSPALLDTRGIVRPEFIVIYYTENPITNSVQLVDLPRDMAYVTGPDPSTGFIAPQVAEVAAANAAAIAAGQPMRYTVQTNGFIGWKCKNPVGTYGTTAYSPNVADVHQPYLADSAGHPTLNCNPKEADGTTTSYLIAEWNAPQCWDGVNGHGGPDARGHVRQPVIATNTSTSAIDPAVCPDHWYKIPGLIIQINYSFVNQAEYTAWKWSSDINPSYSYHNGETGHVDWFGAWDYDVMQDWMHNCSGAMGNTPHQCDYSTIDLTTRLLTDSNIPVGASYQYADPPGSLRNGRIVDDNHQWINQGSKRFAPLPKGPYMMHGH